MRMAIEYYKTVPARIAEANSKDLGMKVYTLPRIDLFVYIACLMT